MSNETHDIVDHSTTEEVAGPLLSGYSTAPFKMRRFERHLTPADAELIRSYVARQAAMQYEAERAGEQASRQDSRQ
jgi:hypothetical protein